MDSLNKRDGKENSEFTPLLPENSGKAHYFDKINNFFRKHELAYLIFAFLLPAYIMFMIYVKMDVHPFGDSSVLALDLNGQYVQFFAALRKAIYGESSFLYSFGRSLGGEFLGIYSYYLASPFSYIVALFPEKNILEALLTIFVLKCGASGLAFGYFLHKSHKSNKTITVALSTLYALCAYSVVMQHNTMWIDGMILLPLLVLGVERIVKYKKPFLYVISLALTLLCNYYIGYMSCIFVAIYYFYYIIAAKGASNPIGEKQHFLRSFARIIVYSFLGIGIAAVLLIPSYYSLTFGKTGFSNPDFSFFSKFDFIDFIAKLFPGAYDTVRPEGLPWIYSGVLSVILLPLYFITKKISKREKIASGVLLILLFASMNINTLDMVWHGFQAPNWLNYRYSFMFSFVVLLLASKTITLIREIGYKGVLASCTVSAILIVVLQKLNLTCIRDGKIIEYFDDLHGVWLSLLCIAIYGSLLMLMANYRANSSKVGLIALIMVATISGELFFNGVYFTKTLNEDIVISNYNSYHGFYDIHQDAVDYIDENSDREFYRIEKTFQRNVTDAFVFGTNGIASSTSTLNADVIDFLAKIGIRACSHWSEYKGGNYVLDSFLGIRYLMTLPTDDRPNNLYEEIYSNENTRVYKNSYALPLAFASSQNIKNISFALPQDLVDYDYIPNDETKLGKWELKPEFANTLWNPFERMNSTLSAISGKDVSVYEPIEYKMSNTITVKQEGDAWNHYVFKSDIDEKSACLTFTVTAPRDGNIYCYFPTKYAREAMILVNSSFLENIYPANAKNAYIMNLGHFSEGETVVVDLYIYTYGEFYLIKDTPYFYYIDEDEFISLFTELSEYGMNITEFSDDYIEGTISVTDSNSTVFTTIPYDSGWKIKVDGKKVDTYETLGALLAFDLEGAGSYEITMKYFPSCYIVGIIISIVSLLALLASFAALIMLRKGKWNFKAEGRLYNFANVFISLPTDSYAEEYYLIDLEIKEEQEEQNKKNKQNKNHKNNKDKK